jgi:hypothetical protein
MTTTMQLTSDIRQRLTKMKETTYDSKMAFVTEFIQNAYRAGAKNLRITIINDEVSFTDDGVGARSPKSILTLDYSEWDSTDEGFGVGFWAILAIPELRQCDIASKKWRAHIDIATLFSNTVPEATIETVDDPTSGFTVSLKSGWFREHQKEIWDEIHAVGALQTFNIFTNGRQVIKRSMLDEVDGDFIHDFSTRKFTARFTVGKSWDDNIQIYYENRLVTKMDMNGVRGVIQLTKRGVDLKEPDRKSIVKNEKYDDFKQKIRDCREMLYLKFLPYASEQQMDDYAYKIDSILNVSQYERYVTIDDIYSAKSVPSVIGCTTIDDEPDTSDYAGQDEFVKVDTSITTNLFQSGDKPVKNGKILLKDAIKAKKRKMWCHSSDRDKFADLISKAEYYGCTVFISNNELHEEILKKHRVPYITELEEGVRTTYISTDVEVKTDKEYNFLKSLIPICRKYGLADNTFKMGNLKMVVATYIDNVLIDKETKGVGGLCNGDEIILDRRHMKIKKYHLRTRPGIGTNELKCIMANMPTISHELAHLIHHTQDNTLNHWETMERIQHEIAEIYREL